MGKSPGETTAFFARNQLVKVCAGLDNFNLESDAEKASFLRFVPNDTHGTCFYNYDRVLKESASSFPPEFSSFKILPSLIQVLEFGGASAAAIVPLVLQLSENISPEDYPSVVLTPLIKLFSSPDRGIRLALLDDLSKYADRLDKKIVVDKIWPHLVRFFTRCTFLIVFVSFSKLAFLILSLLFENRRSSPLPSFHPKYWCFSTLPTEC
jgi:SCY1-like protein 1